MPFFFPVSYKQRLSLSIVALVVALVAVLSALYLRYLFGMRLQIAAQQAERAAEQIRTATLRRIQERTLLEGFQSADLEENRAYWARAVQEDKGFPQRLRMELGASPSIAEIAVTDAEGRVLAATAPRERWDNRPPLPDLLQEGLVAQWRSIYAPHRDYEVSMALATDGRPALVIHVVVTTSLLRGELESQVGRLAVVAVLGLVGALVLGVVFSHVAFRRLDALGQAIDRMTHGEFTPAQPASARDDEYTAISSKLSLLGQQFRDAREGVSSLRGNIQQLMRKLEDAVLLFDRDGRLILANAAAQSFLGFERKQILGLKLEEIFPPGTELGALAESAVRLGRSIEDHLVELGPGARGVTRVLLSIERTEERGAGGTLVVLRDAQARSHLQQQVEVSGRLAAISRLTSGVAHEIKNPLNGIRLYLDLLKNRLSSAGAEPPVELDVIVREMARLDRVVKTFLDFTRPVDLRPTEVPLIQVAREVAALARAEAENHKVRMVVEDTSGGALIRSDLDLLKQAVLNLALNGIQAMPRGGELKLAVSRAGSEVELAVIDQGGGIPAQIRDKIFQLYFTTKDGGSGIGLAMAFRAVQLHNGTIEFASEAGRGTTFRLRFPAVEVGWLTAEKS